MRLGPPTEAGHLQRFVDTVQPFGVWPGARRAGRRAALGLAGRWAAVVGGALLLLFVGHQGLFNGWRPGVLIAGAAALGLLYAGTRPRPRVNPSLSKKA